MSGSRIRLFLLWFYKRFGTLNNLFERADKTAVGLTGHVSLIDESIAKEQKIKPLSKFENWLLKPCLEAERERRQEIFREVCIEFLGEDPNDP